MSPAESEYEGDVSMTITQLEVQAVKGLDDDVKWSDYIDS